MSSLNQHPKEGSKEHHLSSSDMYTMHVKWEPEKSEETIATGKAFIPTATRQSAKTIALYLQFIARLNGLSKE